MDALTKRLIERIGELERRLAIVEASEFTPSIKTWTPAITGTGGNPTVAYTQQTGKYVVISDIVWYTFYILINTISGGSGNVRISAPRTVGTGFSNVAANAIMMGGVDLPGTPIGASLGVIGGSSLFSVDVMQDNAAVQGLAVTALAAGDSIYSTGHFFM